MRLKALACLRRLEYSLRPCRIFKAPKNMGCIVRVALAQEGEVKGNLGLPSWEATGVQANNELVMFAFLRA